MVSMWASTHQHHVLVDHNVQREKALIILRWTPTLMLQYPPGSPWVMEQRHSEFFVKTFQVLDCQNCNQCLKSHKSQGLLKLSEIVKVIRIVKVVRNCQSFQKLSQLAEILEVVRNCKFCQKLSQKIKAIHFFSLEKKSGEINFFSQDNLFLLGKLIFLLGKSFFSGIQFVLSGEINLFSGNPFFFGNWMFHKYRSRYWRKNIFSREKNRFPEKKIFPEREKRIS